MRWNRVGYLRKPDRRFEYTLELPGFLADWDVWDYWEKDRIHSMQQHLTHDDILVDVGAESGWMSLVFGDMVGPSNLILVEPNAAYWPNIRQTWHRRFTEPPRATYRGLLGPEAANDPQVIVGGWPVESDGPLSQDRAYEYLHNEKPDVPVLPLEDLRDFGVPTPTAVTMDVEGAELEVLKGAINMLVETHPKLWISVHPDLMARDYDTNPAELTEFLAEFGYAGTHLGTDHEEHWMFLYLASVC